MDVQESEHGRYENMREKKDGGRPSPKRQATTAFFPSYLFHLKIIGTTREGHSFALKPFDDRLLLGDGKV